MARDARACYLSPSDKAASTGLPRPSSPPPNQIALQRNRCSPPAASLFYYACHACHACSADSRCEYIWGSASPPMTNAKRAVCPFLDPNLYKHGGSARVNKVEDRPPKHKTITRYLLYNPPSLAIARALLPEHVPPPHWILHEKLNRSSKGQGQPHRICAQTPRALHFSARTPHVILAGIIRTKRLLRAAGPQAS